MFQIKQKSSFVIINAMLLLLSFLIAAFFALLVATNAYGAVVPTTQFSKQGQVTLKSPLSAFEGQSERVLDWRNPRAEVYFDLPEGDWSDGLALKLSATPNGQVSPGTPLLISFNNGKPVPLHSQGQRFDATITLASSRIRARNNRLQILYKTPSGADCLTEGHGAWVVDLDRSQLVLKSRPRARDYRIGEFEPRLAHNMSAPKTVSIIAKGDDKVALEALAAQGVGVRMKTVPAFNVTGASANLKVFVGTRSDLKGRITDTKILEGEGARIAMHSGRPMALVITGDTQDEVLSLARSFASFHLPRARRKSAGYNEMKMQLPFTQSAQVVSGTERLANIGSTYFDTNYRPEPARLSFKVSETAGMSGELQLNLSKNASVADTSRVDVTLNGKALGFTKLDKASKRVAFNVPAGALRASENEILISPVLDAKDTGCTPYNYEPGIALGGGSKLSLTDTGKGLSLSRFAASGAPFSDNLGADTTVVLPVSAKRRGAALGILAKAAQTSGSGWGQAQFTANAASVSGGNILILSPIGQSHNALLATAPRALGDALKGKVDSTLTAGIVRFASSDGDAAFRQYAALTASQRASLQRGGIAAIYKSPFGGSKVVGVISSAQKQGFASAATQVANVGHWDKLSGSVTRWDRRRVVVAQAANPDLLPADNEVAKPILNWNGSDMMANFRDDAADFTSQKWASAKIWVANLRAPNTVQVPVVAKAPALAATPQIKTAKSAPAIIAPQLKPARISAPLNQSAALSVPSLRGHAPMQVATAPKPSLKDKLTSALSLQDFDAQVFMTNFRGEMTSLRNAFVRSTHSTVQAPSVTQKMDIVLKNKSLMILLVGVMAVLLLGLASPSSANRNVR